MSSISKLWRKLRNKAYRDGYTEAQLSIEVPFQIRALRKTRGWTQTQLAERGGIPQARISHIEQPGRDPLSLRTLYRLASAFDVGLLVRFVSFSELVHREADFNPEAFRVVSFDDDHIGPTIHTATWPVAMTIRVFSSEEGHLEKATSTSKTIAESRFPKAKLPSGATVVHSQTQGAGKDQIRILTPSSRTRDRVAGQIYGTNSFYYLTTLSGEETLWPQDEPHRASRQMWGSYRSVRRQNLLQPTQIT